MRLLAFALIAGPLFAQETSIRLTLAASGLTQPTDIQHAGDGSNRLFILQQDGRIRIFKNGTLLPNPFLDITSRVLAGGERGLLGLAFAPEYPRKNYFYVNYTQLSGNTVIARYRTTSDPDIADPNSEAILLTINQPFSNHNGGQLRFGPDGFLYIGMGDGGSGGDPFNNAQNPGSLLGKILRIDVESDLAQIRIPPDNPFVNDASYQPAIWALGVRNPWRFSFDRATGDLWIADVGQDRAEEINFQPALSKGGENYGWNLMEGLRCYRSGCNPEGLTLPVLEYSHAEGCSVTGGQVYRGSGSPGLRGTYLYGDFCSGRIWGLRREGGEWVNELLLASNLSISTFGEDEAGEIYVADHARGEIYRVEGSKAPSFSSASVNKELLRDPPPPSSLPV
jgi:glucose/arabinose dehydrogenase